MGYDDMDERKIQAYYEAHPEGVPGIPDIPEMYQLHERHLKWVRRLTPERLLDAGCGKGFLGQAVSPFCGKYHGLDFSSTAVSLAEKRVPHGTFSVASVCSLPYPENTFDCVVCSEVLEHVPRYQQVLSEIHRVLLPGCCILLSTPNVINPDMLWRKWVRGSYTTQIYDQPIPYRRLLAAAKMAGFKVKHFESFWFLPMWGESMPPAMRAPLMYALSWLSRRSRVPLGLYLFCVLRKDV